MATNHDGPRLIRPIPRRASDLRLGSPTVPEEVTSTPAYSLKDLLGAFPDPSSQAPSRDSSFTNLTACTLAGIYSAAGFRPPQMYGDDGEYETDSPAPGDDSAAARPALDPTTLTLVRSRSRGIRLVPPSGPSSRATRATRALLLFVLGVGYGALVTHLRGDHRDDLALVAAARGYDWRYLLFWGAAGVALGALLPWFDGVWEESFGKDVPAASAGRGPSETTGCEERGDGYEMDWALVMRGIGAFVGIVFAIRKLPWTSTMQLSMTLALANPFLWYIIDRSKPGFLLSAAVGLVGSAALMGLGPDMMPTPTGFGGGRPGRRAAPPSPGHRETVETGIWMLSVLFCSCIFFGNIGRRLALGNSSSARGRWGGVR